MNILNFAHPLTDRQLAQIAALAGEPVGEVIAVPTGFDQARDFVPQVTTLLDSAGVSSARLQAETWLVILPSLSAIAAVVLAELHGRMGHFPAIARISPSASGTITTYDVVEIIDLERVRQDARTRR